MCSNGKRTVARTQARPVFTRSPCTSLRDCLRKIQAIPVGATLDRVIVDIADTTLWYDRRWLRERANAFPPRLICLCVLRVRFLRATKSRRPSNFRFQKNRFVEAKLL